MQTNIVLTLTGRDRVGIVEHVTRVVLEQGGNVDVSRMGRLGGEFAMLMLITVPTDTHQKLSDIIHQLQADGFTVTACLTDQSDPAQFVGWTSYQVEVKGADHEGIIHRITRKLSGHGITIESMDTGIAKAPMSGTPLFMMKAIILVPPTVDYPKLKSELEAAGYDLNIDVTISPYAG